MEKLLAEDLSFSEYIDEVTKYHKLAEEIIYDSTKVRLRKEYEYSLLQNKFFDFRKIAWGLLAVRTSDNLCVCDRR